VIRSFGVNVRAVLVAAVVAFVASAVWYIAFSKQRAALSPAAAASTGHPQPTQMLLEFGRNLVLAFVLAYLVGHTNVTIAARAAVLGLLLWIGFPVILLSGSVMYEGIPWRLGAIHAGDWLIKLLLMTMILAVWRR
jgi:hypothetical protein